MGKVCFVTHPEVVVDPDRPVPRWRLAPDGIDRMRAFAESDTVRGTRAIWASDETKAIEAAGILAGRLGLGVTVDAALRENDRSATGFLPPDAFERHADAFFARPEESVAGWERAVDAQARGVAAFEAICASAGEGDLAIVGHGGIGTLLLCHLLGVAIGRAHDQPFQGHCFTVDRASRRVLHRWRPIAPRRS
ncbi:histidine phosphatase family protein [Marinivivus vitaminiproducens]|uniref:histidine phosphatase family protein n=1 Tax=Marinivivus vitaminiproducens TaxID=3035935 RepID=UPI0027A122FB|nr:phosphoglycerate mutase family protein [Geminicoccaceae bacterium SCSIO 64248]